MVWYGETTIAAGDLDLSRIQTLRITTEPRATKIYSLTEVTRMDGLQGSAQLYWNRTVSLIEMVRMIDSDENSVQDQTCDPNLNSQ